HPAELDLALAAKQSFERGSRLARIDFVAESAAGPEREAEEFELVRGRPGAVAEQLEAFVAHVRVGLVGEQLNSIVERADRRHQVMTEARAKQAGEVEAVHGQRECVRL